MIARALSLVDSFSTTVLQICCWVCWWKNFENHSSFDVKLWQKLSGLLFWTSVYICLQICIADEKALFEVCMTWFEHSPEDRRRDVYSIMKCVRFANIDSYYFCDHVQCNNILRACEELNPLFDTVRSYHMLPNRRAEVLTLIMHSVWFCLTNLDSS